MANQVANLAGDSHCWASQQWHPANIEQGVMNNEGESRCVGLPGLFLPAEFIRWLTPPARDVPALPGLKNFFFPFPCSLLFCCFGCSYAARGSFFLLWTDSVP